MSRDLNSRHNAFARFFLLALVAGIILSSAASAFAQRGSFQRPGARRPAAGEKKAPVQPKPLPTDKRLLALHVDFIRKATALAEEYRKKDEIGKAIDCYEEIVKLVPTYEEGKVKLVELRKMEMIASKSQVEIFADKGWQSTGITVLAGKPISIRANGTWTFSFTKKLGPDGIPIPEELRDYNLGVLVGMIDTGDPKDTKPFVIGSGKSFIAEKTGKLYMRMYNAEPNDSTGALKVFFMGTYKE